MNEPSRVGAGRLGRGSVSGGAALATTGSALITAVLEAVAIARRASKLMLQNLWLAAGYNAIAVPIAIAGLRESGGNRPDKG